MDAAIASKRLFPSYTTDELKEIVRMTNAEREAAHRPPLAVEMRNLMETEIAARESGVSRTLAQRLGRSS